MMHFHRLCLLLSVCCLIVSLSALADPAALTPNPSFELGEDTPLGWTLSGGVGAWLETEGAQGNHCVVVEGDGSKGQSNYWRSERLPFQAFSTYRLQFKARQVAGGGGCPTSGPVFCNHDLRNLAPTWTTFTSYFICPSDLSPDDSWIRFGQWEMAGKVAYDAIEILPAQPIYQRKGDLMLGAGETLKEGQYTFVAPLKSSSSNHARTLEVLTCNYNAPRLVFGDKDYVIYKHELPGIEQVTAFIEVQVGYHSSGELLCEASKDGQDWIALGRIESVMEQRFELPDSLFPASSIRIRMTAQGRKSLGENADAGSLQVYGYRYQANVSDEQSEMKGETHFVVARQEDPRIHLRINDLGSGLPGQERFFEAELKNTSQETLSLLPTLFLSYEDGLRASFTEAVELGEELHQLRIPYRIDGAGTVELSFSFGESASGLYESTLSIPRFYETRYGALLPLSSPQAQIWCASSGWKIPQHRAVPTKNAPALVIRTARNEAEAAQLVISPSENLVNFLPVAHDLIGPEGAVLKKQAIEILEVAYVPVTIPTDATGVAAPWPDPLPPFTAPVDLAGGLNHPLWVRVKPDTGTPPGIYEGVITLQAEGFQVKAPLQVEVFDFTLPDRMTCSTAFGFHAPRTFQYHGVQKPEDQRVVYEKYLKALSDHHISPYNPTFLDPIQVTWPIKQYWEGGVRDQQDCFEGKSALKLSDESTERNIAASYEKLIPLPKGGVRLQFRFKTAQPEAQFLATFLHHDEAGQWMSGRNNDIRIKGNGDWQIFEREIRSFPEGTEQLGFRFWPALYQEDGATTGVVWFDALKISAIDSGSILLRENFEALDSSELMPIFDWSAWDAAMTKAIDHYHFNSFRLPIPGMGGGTFFSRTPPSLLGYGEETVEYQRAFTNYCQAVESHLTEKGWLDEAFVYWFDEPDPKDYEFVNNGFRKLKEAAPGIRRMLTEQVEEGLLGGPNIWCPLTPSFDETLAEERRALGEDFWWYVCTGPKAPYVTLFIDHPGTEMRVWGWQSWKRKIVGLLIWETNYWTSTTAFPDPEHPQNPYEDPMGWRVGYGTPKGVKAPWGNGDGRLIYPPRAAASGNSPTPVLDDPVDCIRLEMLRDGIEDYEYMVLLEKAIEERSAALSAEQRQAFTELLSVPPEVSEDLTHFTLDPSSIESHRQKVAHALVALLSI